MLAGIVSGVAVLCSRTSLIFDAGPCGLGSPGAACFIVVVTGIIKLAIWADIRLNCI